MDTVDRFSNSSSSASSLNESPRHSRSTRRSALEPPAHLRDTPASSTMGTNEPRTFFTAQDTGDDDTASSCFEDPERWLEVRDDDHNETPQGAFIEPLPTQDQLEAAANVTIYDADGNSRPFHHLYQGSEHQGQRQMVIFVRHFYCSVCQSYVEALVNTVTPTRYFSLPTPTTITIIGCGSASLLRQYIERTSCPFRMYVDPSRKLYKALGLPMAFVMGKKTDYNTDSQLRIMKKSFGQMFKAGLRDTARGGNWIQVGGEFLFQDGQCIWCHRMGTVRGHIETSVLNKILETSEADLRKARESPYDSPPLMESAAAKSARKSQVQTQNRTSKGGMKLVWEDRGVDAPPRAHLRRSGAGDSA